MNFEKSCGAVIYRKTDENLEFLCISHIGDGHWGFPKGHVEKNENEEQTAIREVFEETGLKVTLIDGFKISVDYSPKKGVMKEVIFFLARVEEEIVYIQLEELLDYKWVSLKDAKNILTYKSSKEVLDKAYAYIITN